MASEVQPPNLVWLLNAVKTLNTTRELYALAEVIVQQWQVLTHSDRAVVLLEQEGHLEPLCSRSTHHASVSEVDFKTPAWVKQAYTQRTPLIAHTTSTDPALKKALQSSRAQAVVCLPLFIGSVPCGVLYADSSNPKHPGFTEEHVTALSLFAEAVAVAIDNAQRFQRATNDPLTGLPNSNHFLDRLAHALAASSEQFTGAVLLLDLDHFKRINQQAGAEMGDKALIDVATTLVETLRADGLVARYGSDKFAVLLPPEDASIKASLRLRDAAERARASVATKTYYGIHLTACIGGTTFPHPTAHTAADLIAITDDILAEARKRGSGQVNIA
jgi:diguanylate cyclase (GGDEF)-like protein